MIVLKTPSEIETMRENGNILASVLQSVCEAVHPGQNTAYLDRLAEDLIRKAGAEPALKGYRGYPATLCASVNNEIVHGIPTEERELDEGDILSIDISLLREGLFVDMATTLPVGEIEEELRHLLCVARRACGVGSNRLQLETVYPTFRMRSGLMWKAKDCMLYVNMLDTE